MKTVHVHLSSGAQLAWDLEDKVAAEVRDLVLASWTRDDPQLRTKPVAFGDGAELTCWLRLSEVIGVEVHPADREESARAQ